MELALQQRVFQEDFRTLGEYLSQRCRIKGVTLVGLSEELGFSRAYIPAVVKGTFVPSRRRCEKIARYFGDEPTYILELAGHSVVRVPEGLDHMPVCQDLVTVARRLSDNDQELLLQFARLLSARSASKTSPVVATR